MQDIFPMATKVVQYGARTIARRYGPAIAATVASAAYRALTGRKRRPSGPLPARFPSRRRYRPPRGGPGFPGGGPGGGPGGRRRRNKTLRNLVMKRKCNIEKLCRYVKYSESHHTRRLRYTGRYTVGDNENQLYEFSQGGKIADHESACAALRFYNPITGLTTTHNPTAASSFHRTLHMSINRRVFITNNYPMNVRVQVYSCTPKTDTSNGPVYHYNAGLADQGGASSNCVLMYPKDSVELKSVWTLKLVSKGTLKPGGKLRAFANTKMFSYSPTLSDSHTPIYQKKYGGHVWLIRLSGLLAHDTVVTNEVGMASAKVDVLHDVVYNIRYNGGRDFRDVTCVDGSNSFTNDGQAISRPGPDNVVDS